MRLWDPRLTPKLVTVLREGLTPAQVGRDVMAGVVVGIVALPLAIAFAIASGVRPEQGLYTAIVAGFVIAALSGSRVQIGGPTGAFVVIVAGVVQRFGYDGLAMATLIAGVLLVGMALARLGEVIRFIPYPVTVGFTTGIAVIIGTGQLRDGLGLSLEHLPAHFMDQIRVYTHAGSVNPAAVVVCTLCVAIVLLWPRVTSRVPGPLVAIVLATVATHLFHLPLDTVEGRFGSIPTSFPVPHMPHLDWALLPDIFPSAISIALLAGIESLLSALVADGMIGGRHRSNAELMAQGAANILSPLFGGIPATGAIARTATNVKNGGRTPLAGIVHAATLLVILLAAGRLAGKIPLAALAGILVVVAYNMSEWRVFVRLFRGPRSDVVVLVTTFLLTVFVDLTAAIQVGVVLAALLFMRRMTEVTEVRAVGGGVLGYNAVEEDDPSPELPPGVEVFEIHGSFCFGAAQKFSEIVGQIRTRPRVIILRMRHVMAMDATGMQALEEVAERFRKRGSVLLVSGVHAQPLLAMEKSGVLHRIGQANVIGTFAEALARARRIVASNESSGTP